MKKKETTCQRIWNSYKYHYIQLSTRHEHFITWRLCCGLTRWLHRRNARWLHRWLCAGLSWWPGRRPHTRLLARLWWRLLRRSTGWLCGWLSRWLWTWAVDWLFWGLTTRLFRGLPRWLLWRLLIRSWGRRSEKNDSDKKVKWYLSVVYLWWLCRWLLCRLTGRLATNSQYEREHYDNCSHTTRHLSFSSMAIYHLMQGSPRIWHMTTIIYFSEPLMRNSWKSD